MNTGTHILSNFVGCKNLSGTFATKKHLIDKIYAFMEEIEKAGMTPLRFAFNFFGEGAVTAAIILAESHVSFHTFPEDEMVTFDVYTCNYQKDNTEATRKIAEYAEKVFGATGKTEQELERPF